MQNSEPLKLAVTEAVPVIHPEATIAEVEAYLLKETRVLETVNYIYVVNHEHRLLGVLSIKELFRTPKTTRVAEVMGSNLVTARPHTEKERVAFLAIEHRLKAIPVTDGEGRLLGVYSSDAILNILHQENIEDLLRFAGIHRFTDPAKSIINASAGVLLKKRLPWLLVGSGGGLIAAFVVSRFEHALQQELLLAAFIPAVVYIADAVGTQTETLFIRTLAINRVTDIPSYVWREMKTALGLAVTLGISVGVLTAFLWSPRIALIAATSFFTTILAAVGITLMLPLLFRRLKIDPAIASGPFATVITDIVSLIIYFLIAMSVFRLAPPAA